MKVIQLSDGFGIDRLYLFEQPKPNPGVGEVLIKLEAASLNYVDLLVVKGLLNPNLPLPYIPVCDGAGVVEQIGQGVTAFKPGDKVVTTFIPDWVDGKPTPQATDYSTRQGLGVVSGQLSEYKVFSVNQLVHSPTNLSALEASTLPIAGLTAWNALKYSNLQRSLNAVRMGGHIPVVGLLDGFDTSINALTLLHQQVTIHGMEVGSTQDFVAMNQAIAAHDIHPVIDAKFTLDQIQVALPAV